MAAVVKLVLIKKKTASGPTICRRRFPEIGTAGQAIAGREPSRATVTDEYSTLQ